MTARATTGGPAARTWHLQVRAADGAVHDYEVQAPGYQAAKWAAAGLFTARHPATGAEFLPLTDEACAEAGVCPTCLLGIGKASDGPGLGLAGLVHPWCEGRCSRANPHKQHGRCPGSDPDHPEAADVHAAGTVAAARTVELCITLGGESRTVLAEIQPDGADRPIRQVSGGYPDLWPSLAHVPGVISADTTGEHPDTLVLARVDPGCPALDGIIQAVDQWGRVWTYHARASLRRQTSRTACVITGWARP